MSKRKSTRSFETEKRMEIRQTGYARMTVSDDFPQDFEDSQDFV